MFKKSTMPIILGIICFSQLNLAKATEKAVEDVGKIVVVDEATAEIAKITHSPMPVSVIDVTKFHGRNISLNELLKRVAGVRVKQQGGLGSRSTIAIQGLEGKRVKIFIDGSPLNSPDGSFGINDIPVQLIERIEVYKGVVPAKFGGDALGGAVNVVTREFKHNYVDLNYSLGSYDTHRASVVLKKNFDEQDIELAVGGFYNQAANDYIMESPYVDGLKIKRDNADFQSFTYAAGAIIKNHWFDKINVALTHYESTKGIQGIQTAISEAKNKSSVNIIALGLEKAQFFNDKLEFKYVAVYADLELNHIDKASQCFNHDGSSRNCSGFGRGEITGVPHDSKDKRVELRHNLNLHYIVNKQHSVNFHLNSQNSKYTPNDDLASSYLGFTAGSHKSNSTNTVLSLNLESAFLNNQLLNDFGIKNYIYDYKVAKRPSIADLNLDTNHHQGNEFGFYNAIRYQPIKDLYLKASYEHAFRLPNNSEIFGDGGQITPAPNLVPEQSDNINLGILFDSYRLQDIAWLKLEANLFYKNLTSMIKLQPGANSAGYINMGKVQVTGFELDANLDLNNNWYIYGNYTRQSLLDKQQYLPGTNSVANPTYDMTMPNVATQYANFGLEYTTLGLFRTDSLLKLFWETSWVDEYFYGYELSRHQDRKIAAQISHGAGFEYMFNDDKFIVSFEVRNLTNQKITDVFNYPLMGRTYHLNLRYVWMEI